MRERQRDHQQRRHADRKNSTSSTTPRRPSERPGSRSRVRLRGSRASSASVTRAEQRRAAHRRPRAHAAPCAAAGALRRLAGHRREAEQPVVEREDHQHDDQQQHRDRAGEAPVQRLQHLLDDELRDHRLAPAAEQRRHDEEADRGDEDHDRAGRDAGQRQREVDRARRPCPGRAPSVAAARGRLRSMFSITDSIVSTASGISACTMPTSTAPRL